MLKPPSTSPRHISMPWGDMLDATTEGASLEYQTATARNQQWIDYGLSLYMDAIESRLGMDDVVPAGQRVAFDTAHLTTPTAGATGLPTEDEGRPMTRTYSLTLTAPAATITAADTDSRRLTGVAIPYGQAGATSAGRLTIGAGAVRIPADLRRVKLFREHGRVAPVGYSLDADSHVDHLAMAFHVGATPDGDLALLEATEGIRDGLSVELVNVEIRDGVVVAADLVGVALVAVPAFPGAVLTASETDPIPDTDSPAGADDPRPAGDPDSPAPAPAPAPATPGTDAPAGDPDPSPEPETDPAPTESETAVTVTASETVRPAPAAERSPAAGPRTLLEFASTLAPVMTAAGDAGQVNAALTDIVPPTADPSAAFMRPTWLGELWTPRRDARHFLNVFSGPALTSMTWEGWKWQ